MPYLDYNQITILATDVIELENLVSLTMDYNKLGDLPENICAVAENAAYLSFAHNKICPEYLACLNESVYAYQDVSDCWTFFSEDVNMDSSVDILDIQNLVSEIFKMEGMSYNAHYNINHDGAINILDINLVIQFIPLG